MPQLVAKVIVELDPASVAGLKKGVESAVNGAFSALSGTATQQMGAKLLKSLNEAAAAAAKAQEAIQKAMNAGASVGGVKSINNITAAIEASAEAARKVAQYFSGAYANALKGIDQQAVSSAIALEKLAAAQAAAAIQQEKLSQLKQKASQQAEQQTLRELAAMDKAAEKAKAVSDKTAAAVDRAFSKFTARGGFGITGGVSPADAMLAELAALDRAAEKAKAVSDRAAREVERAYARLRAAATEGFKTGFSIGKSPVSGFADVFFGGIADKALEVRSVTDALKAGGDAVSATFGGVAGRAAGIGLALGVAVTAVSALVDLGKQFADKLFEAYKHGRELALDQSRLVRILGASSREAGVLQGLLAATGNAGNVFSTITLNQIQARLAELQLIQQGVVKPTEKSKIFAEGLAQIGIPPSAIGTQIKSITDVITAVVGEFDRMDNALKKSLLFEQLGGLFGQDFANVVGLGKQFVTDLVAISTISDEAARANKQAADAVLKSATLRERAEAELASVIFRAGAPLQVAVDNLVRNITLGAAKALGANYDTVDFGAKIENGIRLAARTLITPLRLFGTTTAGLDPQRATGALGLAQAISSALDLEESGFQEFEKRRREAVSNLSFAAGGTQMSPAGFVPLDIFRKQIGLESKATIKPIDQLKEELAAAKVVTDTFVKEGLTGVDNAIMQGIGTMSTEQVAKRLETVLGNAVFVGTGRLKEAAAALKKEYDLSVAVGNLTDLEQQLEGLGNAQKNLTKAAEDYNKAMEKRNATVAAAFSREFDAVQSGTSAYETLFDRMAKAEEQQRKAERGQANVAFAGGRNARQVARDIERLQRGEQLLEAQRKDAAQPTKTGQPRVIAATTQLQRQFKSEDLAALRKSLGFAPGEKVTLGGVQATRVGMTPQQQAALAAALEQQADIRKTVAQRIQNAIQQGAFAGLQFNPDRINDETGKATEGIASSIINAVDGVDLGSVDAAVARKFALGESILKSLAFQAASLPGEAGDLARAALSDTANALVNATIGFGELGTEIKLDPKIKVTPKLLIDTGAFAEGFFSESDRDETSRALRKQVNDILSNTKLTPEQQFAQLAQARLKSLGLDTTAGATGIIGNLSKQLSSEAEREFGLAKKNLEDQIAELAKSVKKDVGIELDVEMDSSSANAAASAAQQTIDAAIRTLDGKVTDITRIINVKYLVNGTLNLPPLPGMPGGGPPPPPDGKPSATGGPAYAQQPYWVGERGPEMFVPAANGRILTVGQSIEFAKQQAVIASSMQQRVPQVLQPSIVNNTTYYSPNIAVDARGATSPAAVERRVKRAAKFISDLPEFQRGRHAI